MRLSEWKKYYRSIGLREDILERNIAYITPLLERGFPPVFDFEHMALLFGRTKENLAGMVNAPKSFYRTFEIPKRKGGKRKILAPYPSLCGCQRWILDNILYKQEQYLIS